MAMLNFLVPMFSWALFYKLGMGIAYNSTRLQECLGKGYNNFLSTKIHYCSYDNPILNIFCWTWLCLFVICMSNIVDAYCLFCCGKHINKSTEKTKRMLSKEAYNNRKRYWNKFKTEIWYHVLDKTSGFSKWKSERTMQPSMVNNERTWNFFSNKVDVRRILQKL